MNLTVDPGLTALGHLQGSCSLSAGRPHRFFQIVFGLVILFGPLTCRAADVTVFAAASLVESLKEIATNYEQQTTKTVVFNFAGSSTLARQIEEGAPADVFFSADEAQMNRLEQKDLLMPGTRRDLLSNTLVVVVAAEHGLKVRSPRDLIRPDIHRLALGDPLSVPIGVYAREYLQKAGLWDRVAPKVVPTENVRGALAAVESGNADASIVYLTDALTSTKVSIAYRLPAEDTPKIRYPAALVRTARQPASQEFLEFLAGNAAAKVFEHRGFIVIR
jgi:molybdate transport system substrate-binding protein